MEVVLPKMRISRKRSQDHEEEQQAKKAKNSDEEMDIGKMEDEEDDGYQQNTKQLDEEFFDSRSGEILEQELFQMARKEEMDFVEKFGVYENATIEAKWVDVNRGTAENPNICCRLVARDFKPIGEIGLTFSLLCRPWRPRRFSLASQRLTKRSSARADGSDRSSCSSTSRRLI